MGRVRYLAKTNQFFDQGTDAILISEFGITYSDLGNPLAKPAATFIGTKDGTPRIEICTVDDFEIIN